MNTKSSRIKLVHKKSQKKKNIFLLFFTACHIFLRARPKLISTLIISIILTLIVSLSIKKINFYSEQMLPTSVNIEINNPKIYNSLSNDIYKAINNANKNHEKRSVLLNRIHKILQNNDQLDQYWIRLGLDRNLQINATLQVPLLILETKSLDKYVVSSTAKIIAKNPNTQDYPGLFYLSAPELKINWKQKNKAVFSSKEPLNFPWLINETKIIYSTFQSLQLNFLISKVLWNSSTGFQLKLTENTLTESNSFLVTLGTDKLVSKITKLKTLLVSLSTKNLHPTEIDLDYTDKASFKVSVLTPLNKKNNIQK